MYLFALTKSAVPSSNCRKQERKLQLLIREKNIINGTAKEFACNSGDTGATGSVPGPGRSPGEGNDNPLQQSCLENPMDRGPWQSRGFKEWDMTEQLTLSLSREHAGDLLLLFQVCK